MFRLHNQSTSLSYLKAETGMQAIITHLPMPKIEKWLIFKDRRRPFFLRTGTHCSASSVFWHYLNRIQLSTTNCECWTRMMYVWTITKKYDFLVVIAVISIKYFHYRDNVVVF